MGKSDHFQPAWARRTLCRLSLAALMLLPTAFSVAADSAPRGIGDITRLLHEYKPDSSRADAARAQLERKPPEGASKRELIRFQMQAADAAEQLGLQGRMLESRRMLATIAEGEADHPELLRQLAASEMQSGNYQSALKNARAAVEHRAVRGGSELLSLFNISRIQGFIGEVAEAKLSWNQGNAVFNRIRSAPTAASFVNSFEALRDWAKADIAIAEGKSMEAESALRASIAAWDKAIARAVSDNDLTLRLRVENSRELSESRLVSVLVSQGKLFEAEIIARGLLRRTLSRVGKDSPQSASAVLRMAQVLLAQGRFKDADTLANETARIYGDIGGGANLMLAPLSLLSHSYFGREDWTNALVQLDRMRSLIEAADDVSRRVFRGSAETAIVLVKGGRVAQGLAMAQATLADMLRNFGKDHPRTAEVRGAHAMALAASAQDEAALREFAEALRVMLSPEAAVIDIDGSALQRIKRRVIIEAYIELLARVRDSDVVRKLGIDAAGEAFRLADAARAGSVQKALAASAVRALANEPGLGELIRKDQDLAQEMRALYDNILRLVSQPAEQQLPKVIADMRSRLLQIEREQKQTFAAIEKRFPEYANLVNPKPATLEEARKALRPGEALLSVFSTREKSYVWSVNPAGKLSFTSANIGERDIAAIVAGLRKTLDPGDLTLGELPAFDYAGAHKLYASLIAPAEAVWSGANVLVFAASGALSQIPLAILPTAPVQLAKDNKLLFGEMRQVPWLARKIAVVDVPSVTALSRLRALPPGNPQRQAFAGFGDPVFSKAVAATASVTTAAPVQVAAAATRGLKLRSLQIPRLAEDADTSTRQVDAAQYAELNALPDTREEILSIAKALGADPDKDVFLGLQASRPQVQKTDLSKRRIVAFATHGLIPGDLPDLEQPALALSVLDDSKASPLLTLDDVLGLKLDADWVVLSACNTAAADGQGAEAVSGLGRGFFYAGSRALLVTHWPVETVSARLLTTGIFERYARPGNVTRAEALNASMRALMEGTANGQYSYAHPLFWAPYALIGDGGR